MAETRVVFIDAIIVPLNFSLDDAHQIASAERTLKSILEGNGWSINWLAINVASPTQTNLDLSANVQTQFNQSEIQSYFRSQLAEFLRITWIQSYDQVIQTTTGVPTTPPVQPPSPPISPVQPPPPAPPLTVGNDIFSQIGNFTGLSKIGLPPKAGGVLALGLVLVILVKSQQK